MILFVIFTHCLHVKRMMDLFLVFLQKKIAVEGGYKKLKGGNFPLEMIGAIEKKDLINVCSLSNSLN